MTRDYDHRRTGWRIGTALLLMAFALLALAILTGAPAASARTQQQTDPGCVYTGGGWICYGTFPPGQGPDVDRLGGADRYETAAAIATYTQDPDEVVLIVAAGDGIDALAAGTHLTGPMVLVPRGSDNVPQATLDAAVALNPDRVIVLGGPGAVSDTQANTILYALVP